MSKKSVDKHSDTDKQSKTNTKPEASEDDMNIEVKEKTGKTKSGVTEEQNTQAAETENKTVEAENEAAEAKPEESSTAETGKETASELSREQLIDHLQRLAAEFDNFRKRSTRDYELAALGGMVKVISEILPVLDSFERSLVATSTGEDSLAWREGMRAIHRQLAGNLEKLGLEKIEPAKGEIMDPNFHEVMFAMPSDEVEPDHILEVFIVGYKLGKRLLRPAKVKVAMAVSN